MRNPFEQFELNILQKKKNNRLQTTRTITTARDITKEVCFTNPTLIYLFKYLTVDDKDFDLMTKINKENRANLNMLTEVELLMEFANAGENKQILAILFWFLAQARAHKSSTNYEFTDEGGTRIGFKLNPTETILADILDAAYPNLNFYLEMVKLDNYQPSAPISLDTLKKNSIDFIQK